MSGRPDGLLEPFQSLASIKPANDGQLFNFQVALEERFLSALDQHDEILQLIDEVLAVRKEKLRVNH